MQFMLIFSEPMSDFAKRTNPAEAPAYWGAWTAYMGAMAQAGVMVNGDGLQPPHTGVNVKVRDGRRDVQDGPYADTKEHLGGYVVIEVADLDAALEWAARSPNASTGHTQVRPVLPPMNGSVN